MTMKTGFYRVASCSPRVDVANVKANVLAIIDMVDQLNRQQVNLAVFPEMCITGYTCADLFHNQVLLDAAIDGIKDIMEHTFTSHALVVVGTPIVVDDTLYNCAVAIGNGAILGIVPKSYLPNYNEFYEKRWWQFAPMTGREITIPQLADSVYFGTDLIIDWDDCKIAFEICEDLWTPIPPSSYAALAGAQVIVNLSASDDVIGKYAYLRSLVLQQSARCIAAYVYSSAGYGESSTDLVFDAKNFIAENGSMIAESQRWRGDAKMVVADIDLLAIDRDRMHIGSFNDSRRRLDVPQYHVVAQKSWDCDCPAPSDIRRFVDPLPFVPSTSMAMDDRCHEIINIQVAGLAKRLDFIHCRKMVIGVSGGLDSTLALLVGVRAFDRLGLDRGGIIGITMPGFGTSDRTYDNAVGLMKCLGITMREISIADAVNIHFRDIDHDPSVKDVTYENSQARERTQILMDVANQEGGIVLGTGDLSELALGWATYNGDHMSMYAVNAGVPKTLVRHLVRFYANSYEESQECRNILLDIIDTPISPELTPTDSQGKIAQKTEDLIGPYELHDFFLYYTLRYGFSPRRIFLLARRAFDGRYTEAVILRWMREFFRRFFSQQFKRSCLPDGPKVGSVCLSPRGDWRMPSDASSALWLAQIDSLIAENTDSNEQ